MVNASWNKWNSLLYSLVIVTSDFVEKNWMRSVNMLLIKIYQMTCPNILFKDTICCESISYLFKFIQFSTRMYTYSKWVAMEKVVLIFPHLKWLGLAIVATFIPAWTHKESIFLVIVLYLHLPSTFKIYNMTLLSLVYKLVLNSKTVLLNNKK